jgi:uncharacterized protein (TIGR02099 family)
MPGKLLRRIYHACWYIFAAVVLTSATFITLIRIMLPHVGNYREELQNMVSRQTGYTVRIENVMGEWEGWVPIIRLDGINISTTATDQNITRLKSATIRFDPYTSFRQGQFTPFRLTITGPDLTMVRGTDGSLSIATDTTKATVPETGTSNVPFASWLFLQKTIAISGARIRFMDARKNFEPVLLTNVDLVLKNSAAHMQINGSMALPAAYGEKCSFALDLYGDISTPEWSGQIYVEAIHARPDAWLSHIDADASLTLGGTPADVRVWSSWQGARLTRINGTFVASDIHLALGAAKLDVQHIDALFTLVPDQDNGLRIKVRMKELRTGNGAWPVTEASVSRQPRADGEHFRYITHIDYLNLKDVTTIFRGNANTKNSFVSGDLDASGDLLDCLIVYNPERPPAERIAFDTRVRGLTVGKIQNLRIRNLDGHLAGNTGHGVISLDTPSSEITVPGMLHKTFTLNELQGDIRWRASHDSLRLETAHLQAHTPHFNATLKGNIMFTAGNNLPFVDLLFSAGDLDLENIRYYMPTALPQRTHDWIKQALVAGDVSALDMVLRGQLAEFPFDNNEGRIEVIANIHNGTLDYHADWVPVDNIEAELRIDGRSLTVDANSGNIYNAVITRAQGIIADLGADTNAVGIRGTIKGHTKDALTFIKNSPLSESRLLGEVTRHTIDGAFTLDLGLHIPLHDMPITYDGNIHFDDTTLKSPAYGIDLDHITGDVAFTENRVSTEGLTADYFNEPVNLIINTDEKDGLHLGLQGNSNSSFIAAQLAHFFQASDKLMTQLKPLMGGNCEWQAILSPLGNPADAQTTDDRLLRISSSLAGLTINLPAPLGKTHDPQPLEITTTISTSPHKHMEFIYGGSLAGSIDLNRSDAGITMSRVELSLGPGATLSKEGTGIIVHGAINALPLSEWYSFFHAMGENIFSTPIDNLLIDITAGTLGLAGQHFEDTHFKLLREAPDWHVILSGGNIDGNVFIPATAQPGAVRGAFSRLKITRAREEHPRMELDPGVLPPLQFTVDDFTYGDFSLGKMELNTVPGANGMSIDKLSFNKPELAITGKGMWTSNTGHENSEFDLDLRAETLATMLTTFNYSMEPVKDGVSRFILKAQWPGSPMDFSLASLTGSLNMKIEKGQFLNIEPKAGRLFGLLNLQTLIRLMSLDLSVLFSKGYTFDKIEGSFTIESGNAYTNNLAVKGHSADIELTGRTGLVDKDYDQIATITPRALFGPIGVGLGAVIFIAGEVFESIPEKIDQLLRYQYTIKGGWEAPVIEKYNSEY